MAERVLPYPEALAEVLAAAASLSSTNAGQTRFAASAASRRPRLHLG